MGRRISDCFLYFVPYPCVDAVGHPFLARELGRPRANACDKSLAAFRVVGRRADNRFPRGGICGTDSIPSHPLTSIVAALRGLTLTSVGMGRDPARGKLYTEDLGLGLELRGEAKISTADAAQ